ncbi:hypothetical protein [Burkholderia ambifaria]|uniref:hypothetical protein n=1 Tax=Burkholderia ambifaria TaxID=152480 RepID=UPI000F8007E7|nr:hypothetical protein [Burkholderia ambifaria]
MSLELNPSDRSSLLREQQNLDLLIGKTDLAIAAATVERNRSLERAVREHLPALTGGVRDTLALTFPGFLTVEHEQTFAQHGKIFGLFNRATTREKLVQLQAQFRAYLEQAGYCQDEDDELRRLSIQKVNLTRELQDVTRQLIKVQPVTPVGGRVMRGGGARESLQYDDDFGGSGDDGFVNGLMLAALDNALQVDGTTVAIAGSAPDAVTVMGSDTPATDTPSAACIDTTDQLGCFS